MMIAFISIISLFSTLAGMNCDGTE